ncbi:protocadherin alpha-2-like isoform X2 [Oenanthe melanoleuca]|uniref:protocadherin alpha-2-like isoform X2 n=1 Tax=Oenanthe melanoleuca TaxID=2939378 RepID=UPI0024C169D2|nr:protocadherin alpha-2-like isoform X2 [Oenanthe melanoleuca]
MKNERSWKRESNGRGHAGAEAAAMRRSVRGGGAAHGVAAGSGTACGRLRPGAAESPAVSAGGRRGPGSRAAAQLRAAAGSRAGPGPGPAGTGRAAEARAAAAGMEERCCAALLRLLVLQAAWALAGGQVRYSVPEEAKAGTVVGRLAQDLGLEAGEAEARRLRLVAQGRRASVEVSGASGALLVSSRLDREELCGKSAPCALRLEVLLERPLRVFHVQLEVTDINDNAPVFPAARRNISIAELTTPPGSRFPLEGASDADIGANSELSYTLSPSEHFTLDIKSSDENRKSLFLVLTKTLDRETIPEHRLVLTATDGGRPSMTGTMELVISVLDANDNAPQFNQSVYKVQLPESAREGTVVARMNATDPDEGSNKEFFYSILSSIPVGKKELFTIDAKTGEIRLAGPLDFEDVRLHELHIEATDKGSPPLSGHCSVELEVLDVNDNAPEVWVTSLSVPVSEDASVGTVVALLSVSDRDSGANGRVRCWVWPALPFGLEATFAGSYSLVLREALDRERVSEYEVEVRAEDGGAPALRASRGLRLPVSDVNDNAPAFAQAVYTVLARENNAAGAELARLWARDPDEAGNGRVSYSLWEGGAGGGGAAPWSGWRAASSYVALDAESGRLWALQPLDYEQLQVLQFEVRAVDAGEPPLCGNATVQLFVLDENDNAPALLPPAGSAAEAGAVAAETAAAAEAGALSGPGSGSGTLWAWAAWGAPAGQVLAKIRAVDADSGYNAWLRYELWEPRGKGPFRVGLYSGEVSTARPLDEADGPRHRLLIVVRDHGEPARSATATLSVSLLEPAEAALAAAAGSSAAAAAAASGSRAAAAVELGAAAASAATNVWLVVAICAVSSLFLLALVLYGASRWAPRAAVLSAPGPTTLVCASEVGSWSYSQRHSRSLCVADGAPKSDLMVFSPNFPPPPPGPAPKDTQPEPSALLDTPKHPNPDWRYSASLRAGMQSAVHMEEAGVLRGGPAGPDQQWPTVSSATAEPEAGEVSPPVGAGVNSNSWTFKFGPGNSKQGGPESKKQTQVSFLLRRKGESSQYSQ